MKVSDSPYTTSNTSRTTPSLLASLTPVQTEASLIDTRTTSRTSNTSRTTPSLLASFTPDQTEASLFDILKVWFYLLFGVGMAMILMLVLVIQCLVDWRLTPAATPPTGMLCGHSHLRGHEGM